MKTKIIHDKGYIRLIIDDPQKSRNESDVLAVLSNYADSSCWTLEDIRLTKYRNIGRYWAQSADTFTACYCPKDESESAYVKSKLHDYHETPEGELLWCTFDGIVKGQPEINGYTPPQYAGFNRSVYFSRQEGLQKLKEIKVFWDDLENLEKNWRIENPNAQASQGEIFSACSIRKMYIDQKITSDQFEKMESNTAMNKNE